MRRFPSPAQKFSTMNGALSDSTVTTFASAGGQRFAAGLDRAILDGVAHRPAPVVCYSTLLIRATASCHPA